MADALIICPEAPYPVIGGGPLRTACLVEYLAARYSLDVIAFQEPGARDPRTTIPLGLVRNVDVVELPYHSKSKPARLIRNIRRYTRRIPPLMDRFGGFALNISRRYDIGVIEHFWCATYVHALRPHCKNLVLNLHNIESVLLQRSAAVESLVGRALLTRFAQASRDLEADLLPKFDNLLVTSETDRATIGRGLVWPNTIPERPLPRVPKRDEIVFSGNMAYLPNTRAAQHFARNIWPQIRESDPGVAWRLAGKNPDALHGLHEDPRVRVTGPMEDAVSEIATARAAVVPLLSGSGTRFKILEAWAAGTPVISTSIGAEGLNAVPGTHLLIADTDRAFSDAVLRVLNDDNLAARLASAGRLLYEAKFTWPSAWKTLEEAGL